MKLKQLYALIEKGTKIIIEYITPSFTIGETLIAHNSYSDIKIRTYYGTDTKIIGISGEFNGLKITLEKCED